jgi:hypothetical protein
LLSNGAIRAEVAGLTNNGRLERGMTYTIASPLIAEAAAAHARQRAEATAASLELFKTRLREILGRDVTPTDTIIELDGLFFELNGQYLQLRRECPRCRELMPGAFVHSLEDVGAELARPIIGHCCNPPKPNDAPAEPALAEKE